MAGDPHKYTREHLAEVISRLRESSPELDRLSATLPTNFKRTLQRDVAGNWEARKQGRKIDPDYMYAVCNTYLNRFTSPIYNSIAAVVASNLESQKTLDAMLGKYTGYWPSGAEGTFATWPMEIQVSDGMYTVSSITGDDQYHYSHRGFAFLVRHRVHVIDARKNGIRAMLFHYEEFPARNPVKGIILNVLRTENNAKDGEKLFASHFVAIHENDERYNDRIPDRDIAALLYHSRNRTGVIRI